MTLSELRNDLGSSINQTDSSGDFVSGFITTTEADRWINQYFEEVYKWYAVANRDRFAVTSTGDTVEDQATYTFGGDATDLLAVAWVGIMYDSTDEDYTKVIRRDKTDVYLTGSETWSQSNPIYFEKQIYNTSSEHYELGIEFPEDCIPDEAVTEGLKVMYIERPSHMSDDTDIPEKLPSEIHKHIITGAAIPCFEKMGEYEKAEVMRERFSQITMSFMVQEQSLNSDTTKRIRMSRRDVNNFYRYDR